MGDETPVLGYAQGGFDKPLRTWTALGVLDLLMGIISILLNTKIIFDHLSEIYHPIPPDPEDIEFATAVWQRWAGVADGVVAIALAVLLFVAVRAMLRGGAERRAMKLHVVYVAVKVTAVVTYSLLYAWDVDKARIDWGLFGAASAFGLFYPLLVLAMLVHIVMQTRRREAEG